MKVFKKILAIVLVAIALFAVALPAMAETFSVAAGTDKKSAEYLYQKSNISVDVGITFQNTGAARIEFHSYNEVFKSWDKKGERFVYATQLVTFPYLKGGNETMWRVRVYNTGTTNLTAVVVCS